MAWAAHGVEGSKAKTRTRVRALLNSVKVRSTEVLFSQDTGFANFSDGRWVAQTMREILSGQLDPASLSCQAQIELHLSCCIDLERLLWPGLHENLKKLQPA